MSDPTRGPGGLRSDSSRMEWYGAELREKNKRLAETTKQLEQLRLVSELGIELAKTKAKLEQAYGLIKLIEVIEVPHASSTDPEGAEVAESEEKPKGWRYLVFYTHYGRVGLRCVTAEVRVSKKIEGFDGLKELIPLLKEVESFEQDPAITGLYFLGEAE